jgi:hypothetical protein
MAPPSPSPQFVIPVPDAGDLFLSNAAPDPITIKIFVIVLMCANHTYNFFYFYLQNLSTFKII